MVNFLSTVGYGLVITSIICFLIYWSYVKRQWYIQRGGIDMRVLIDIKAKEEPEKFKKLIRQSFGIALTMLIIGILLILFFP